ncbi:TFIIB-type zinc ribbon-containing protein [Glacieibacterium frigidum]|uniref:Transcription factor zinc-finger domain-containing protein n=1 Tax=Glacieibacterium frigidum TaxID=2593303 RepID=A0A552UA70_9SPHN|nr:zf-TFIIB domain-containing protein [Glacieibacterium frigidum]TRW15110.1 hypothetical protein FMM06_15810 [Glacieibacterium frigidum]
MPLLLCPNDNGAMQTVQRSGVEFDICPTCRGVWLDRGELEKLLAVATDDAGQRPPPPPQQHQQPYDNRPQYRPEGRRDWDYDDDYRRKKKRSLFDMFD